MEEQTKLRSVKLNKILIPVMFIVFSIILEFVNFIYLGFKDINGNAIIFPYYFLFDIAIMIIIAGFMYLIHNKIAMNIVCWIFLTLQLVINIVNSTMYNIFGDILSFDLLKLGAEATTAITADFIDWGGVFLNIIVFVLMIVVAVLVQKTKKEIKLKIFSVPVIILAVFIMSQSLGYSLFTIQSAALASPTSANTEIQTSDEYLWDNFQFKLDAFKKFGYYGFYAKSVYNLAFKNEKIDKEYYQNFIDSGYQSGNTEAPLYGDNLIVILCESLDWYAIDPFNTPTLWAMAGGEDTIVLKNFYARNRTNISEGITLLGNMPKETSTSSAYESGYKFEYSLPNLFKLANDGKETTTAYFHNNYETFYQRDITHGKDGIGFDDLYFQDAYTADEMYYGFGYWRTDVGFTENLMDKFIPDEGRFLTYFASLSTHGPYNYRQPYLKEYYDIFDSNFEQYSLWVEETQDYQIPKNSKDFELFHNYKSAVIDLDRTIANIIEVLKEKGRYDSTSMVLFADHNSYYTDLCYKVKGVEKSDFSNTYINNIPVFFWSPKLTGGNGYVYENFCNTYDILPTICEIFGLPSNSNMFQGYSLFSSNIKNSFFASHLSGMFTDRIFSMNINDVYIKADDVSSEEIARFRRAGNKYFEKQNIIEKIYKYGVNGTRVITI